MWASAPTNVYEKTNRADDHVRPYKYAAPPAHTQMACHFHGSVFFHLLARQLFPMRALSPRRRRCSIDLQRVYRVLAAMFFYGVLLWHCGTIRSASSASFCPLFLARQKKWVCEATVAVLPHQWQFRCKPETSGGQGRPPLRSARQNRRRRQDSSRRESAAPAENKKISAAAAALIFVTYPRFWRSRCSSATGGCSCRLWWGRTRRSGTRSG